jgi:hypothetical protein
MPALGLGLVSSLVSGLVVYLVSRSSGLGLGGLV